MAKDNEEIISNTSYTESDFRSIYPQLLDVAKKLTNKWDPTLSNESDPGNILIKEAAIVADKNNYHVDKNTLECFPLSATQQASARQLYDLAGYKMHWYQSAVAPISFTLTKSLETIVSEQLSDNSSTISSVVIPAGTSIVDSSGEYVYTTLFQTAPLTKAGQTVSVNAIQGNIIEYEINGLYNITLNNLDENLRLYFPQNTISENGIFVFNEGDSPNNQGYSNTVSDEFKLDIKVSDLENTSGWVMVDNLSEYPAGSKIFSFGLDLDSDTCYIQFPEDIAASDLIGSGLNIYYTTTLGENGTIKSNVLSTFASDFVVTTDDNSDSVVINDYIVIKNEASSQGKNPESLQAAYKNYKKTIGTFNTLVSKRDYDNAIYNIKNNLNTGSLISNGFVTDRTSDINMSQNVIAADGDRNYTKSCTTKLYSQYSDYSSFSSTSDYVGYYVLKNNEFILVTINNKDSLSINAGTTIAYIKSIEDAVNSYDVVLYLLQASDSMNYISDYNNTFETDISDDTLYSVKSELDEYKAVQHDFSYIKDLGVAKYYHHINNLCRLTGVLNTYYKISAADAKIIQDNVIKTLLTKYNSREIDFGNELDYNELLETIVSADSRIKSVSLNIPEYEPIMNYVTGTATSSASLYEAGQIDDCNKTIAKMVLAGNVQLFKFDEDFQIDFGQSSSEGPTGELATISTVNTISVNCTSNEDEVITNLTTLDENDLFQIITPSLVTVATYNPTVKYTANFTTSFGINDTSRLYTLQSGETIELIYNDSGVQRSKSYDQGTILRVNGFNISAGVNNIIKTNQSIEVLEISRINIPAGARYYVISNSVQNGNYTLQLSTTPTILGENEYLVYSDNLGSGLVVLGSGTTLTCSSNVTLTSKKVSLESIMSASDSTIQNIWSSLQVAVTAQENAIVNLGVGDSVGVLTTTAGPISVSSSAGIIELNDHDQHTSDLDSAATGIIYRLKTEEDQPNSVIKYIGLSDYTISVRSNMLLNMNSLVPQVLNGNQQVIAGTYTWSSGKSILCNYPLNMVGGTNIDVTVLNEVTGQQESKIKLYAYTKTNVATGSSSITSATARENGLLSFKGKDVGTSQITLSYDFKSVLDSGNNIEPYTYYLVPITAVLSKNIDLTFSLTGTGTAYIADSLTTIDSSAATTLAYSGDADNTIILNKTLVIKCNTTNADIKLKFVFSASDTTDVTTLTFMYMKHLNGLNNGEIDCEATVNDKYFSYDLSTNIANVLTKIASLPGESEFNWSYKVPDKYKVLKPLLGASYFNINHIYNQCVLSTIDFENTSIKVNSSNIL